MKSKVVMCTLVCTSLMFGPCLQSAVGDRIPEYEDIEQITKDISTPETRSAAIAKLSAIVQDSTQNMMLREYAGLKLGDLRATEAKDMLKNLAESLDWGDSTRQLKRATTLAYWKIQVAVEPNEAAQEELLTKLLFGKTSAPPHADVVPHWAADELANRGVKEALPEIIRSIRSRDRTERGENRVWLCKTKIELLSTSASRYDALAEALLIVEDRSPYQRLKEWAIEELGKEKDPDGRWLLLSYALQLQERCYDENGKWIVARTDPLSRHAHGSYSAIIKILKDSGMTDMLIKAWGLRPDKFFVSV